MCNGVKTNMTSDDTAEFSPLVLIVFIQIKCVFVCVYHIRAAFEFHNSINVWINRLRGQDLVWVFRRNQMLSL